MLRFTLQMPPGTKRLYTICLYLALGSALWGYNIGILSSILAHPGWKNTLHSPSPAQKGVVTGIYYGGTLLSYLFVSHLLADVLGRRYSAVIGTGILAVGALIMASAGGGSAVAVMAFGRFISGLGVGVVSTGVPLYQSEIAPAKDRGRFVTMNHAGFIGGLAMGLWYVLSNPVRTTAQRLTVYQGWLFYYVLVIGGRPVLGMARLDLSPTASSRRICIQPPQASRIVGCFAPIVNRAKLTGI